MKDEGKEAARTEQGVESCRDDDGGKHERNRRQRAQEGFAAEVEAGEEDGGRESEEESQKRGESRLVKGETQNRKRAPKIGGGQDGGVEAESEDARQREQKEDGEEEDGREEKESGRRKAGGGSPRALALKQREAAPFGFLVDVLCSGKA